MFPLELQKGNRKEITSKFCGPDRGKSASDLQKLLSVKDESIYENNLENGRERIYFHRRLV